MKNKTTYGQSLGLTLGRALYWLSLAAVAGGALLALFGGHPCYGFLLWFAGCIFQIANVRAFNSSRDISVCFGIIFAVLGIFGTVFLSMSDHWNGDVGLRAIGCGLYGLITAAIMICAAKV